MFSLPATNILFPTVEQWGHDRWVFTSLKLVSFSFVMAFQLCAVVRFCFKILILDYLLDFSQQNMKQLDVPLFSWWMLIVLKCIHWLIVISFAEVGKETRFDSNTAFNSPISFWTSLLYQVRVCGQGLCLASSRRQICCSPNGWFN